MFSGRKRSPDLQFSRRALTLTNFDKRTCSAFTFIQTGLINSLLGPSLTRSPNQFEFEGIEALHLISLVVKSTFLSISQSSKEIKLVKLFKPAFTDVKLEIKRVQKRKFFKNPS